MNISNYDKAKVYLDRLINGWDEIDKEAEARRKIRKQDFDIKAMRYDGKIPYDSFFIPMRIIDSNIRREMPVFVNFINTARRIAVFSDIDAPSNDTSLVEEEFTRKAKYDGWLTPFLKVLDGAEVHGVDYVEVEFNENKPGHFSVDHIGHENLIFDKKTKDIQQQKALLRRKSVTLHKLESLVNEFGFNAEQVALIRQKRIDTRREDEPIDIYKVFTRQNGVVKVAWYTKEGEVTTWLKNPVDLYLGIDQQTKTGWKPIQHKIYPIFMLPFQVSEEDQILELVGRVYLDEPKQEAMTALASSACTKAHRSSNVYGSPKNDDGSSGSIKVLETVNFKDGTILNKPFDFFYLPGPDEAILKLLQYFEVQQQQESGNVDFAVSNRKDSRKTAREIQAAEQQAAALSIVQIVLFSIFLRSVYTLCWRICQSRALQGLITFLPQQSPDRLSIQNNINVIARRYDIRPAGDVDIIERQELIQRMKEAWPVYQTTPLRDKFLEDLTALMFPHKVAEYVPILRQQNTMNMLVSSLKQMVTLVEGSMSQEEFSSQPPEQQRAIIDMLGKANGLINGITGTSNT